MSGTDGHHVIARQRIAQARSKVAIKAKRFEELTEAEDRLLNTPLTRILTDRRNQVRLTRALHHRAHHGSNPHRLKEKDLPAGIHDFAADYGLEWALDRELALMNAASSARQPTREGEA